MSRARVPDTDITTPRRETFLGLVVLFAVLVIGYLSTTAIDGSPLSSPYRVQLPLPAESPIVRSGDPVRIGGRRAGQVRRIQVAADGRHAVATLELSDAKIGPGASARVRLKGLAGATYVELSPGDTANALPSGSTVTARRVTGAAQLADVVAGFDRDTRVAMARAIDGTGAGLAGRGTVLSHTLATLPGTLTQATPLLRAMTPQPGVLTGLVDAVDQVAASASPPGSTQLGELVPAARRVFRATGDAAGDLDQTIAALPGAQTQVAQTLPRADTLLADLRVAATRLRPGIDALHDALPAVLAVERAGGGLGTLASVARTATPVLAATRPVLEQLRGSALALPAVADPVATLSTALVPYRKELVEAPAGFTRWGDFVYQDGQAAGHRAVRFSMIFTCAKARNPYPAAGAAHADRSVCR